MNDAKGPSYVFLRKKTLLQMDKACYVASVTHQEYKICADICKSQTRGLTSQLQEPWEPWEADMAAKP